MEITRHSLLDGARSVSGTAVIIDVFRAFSCAALLHHLGVADLYLEENPDKVLELKSTRGFIALGENEGVMIEGFDLGNSPTEILAREREFFRGKTVVQRTSAGVRGIFAAFESGAERVFAAGYSTAAPLAARIIRANPENVHLVAMGLSGREKTPEDERLGDYLESLLTNGAVEYDHFAALQSILTHESAQKFLRGDRKHYPPTDVTYCLQKDIFDFALEAVREEGMIRIEAV